MFETPDRARVRIDFEFEGIRFCKGDWLKGNFVIVGRDRLRFEITNTVLVLPDYFDRFEVSANCLKETFGIDLGKAADHDDDENENWEEAQEPTSPDW